MALTGRGREPQADMDAARVLDLLEHLDAHGIALGARYGIPVPEFRAAP